MQTKKSPTKKTGYFFVLARLAAGFVLFASGFLKLVAPAEDFAASIQAYQILPASLLLPLAKTLPWVELFAGGFLMTGYLTKLAAVFCGILGSVFFLALAITKFLGASLPDCGCFGSIGPHLEAWQAMILDIFLMTLAACILKAKKNPWSLDNWIAKK